MDMDLLPVLAAGATATMLRRWLPNPQFNYILGRGLLATVPVAAGEALLMRLPAAHCVAFRPPRLATPSDRRTLPDAAAR